jgi:hypothetical protein
MISRAGSWGFLRAVAVLFLYILTYRIIAYHATMAQLFSWLSHILTATGNSQRLKSEFALSWKGNWVTVQPVTTYINLLYFVFDWHFHKISVDDEWVTSGL